MARATDRRFVSACLAAMFVLLPEAAALGLTPTIPPPRSLGETEITGRVLDGARQVPVAGALVELHAAGVVGVQATTDADGIFSVTLELYEDYWVRVSVTADGYLPWSEPQGGLDLWRAPHLDIELQPRVDSLIRGRVYDASQSPAEGIGGASIDVAQSTGRAVSTADAVGDFIFTLAAADAETVAIWFSAAGFQTRLESFSAAALRQVGTLQIGLTPLAPRQRFVVAGTVYDAALGIGAPIAGAAVTYSEYGGDYGRGNERQVGMVQSDANGDYRFEVDLDPTHGGVDIGVEADGYATRSDSRHVTSLTGEPVDLALARLGGVIEISPIYATIVAAGQLDVAIGNPPDAADSLVILEVEARQHYGSGSGRGFTVDADAIALPAVLEPGEHVVLPVSYDGTGEHLPASLLISVVSGATEGDSYASLRGWPTEPPVVSPTPPVPPTEPPSRISIALGTVSGRAGERVAWPLFLASGNQSVTALQIDLDPGDAATFAGGDDACRVNPDIDKNESAFRIDCTTGRCLMRAIIIAFDNVDPIPDGSELITCDLQIADAAAPARYPLRGWNVGASGAEGNALPAFADDGVLEVLSADDRETAGDVVSNASSSGGCQVPGGSRSPAAWILLLPLLPIAARKLRRCFNVPPPWPFPRFRPRGRPGGGLRCRDSPAREPRGAALPIR